MKPLINNLQEIQYEDIQSEHTEGQILSTFLYLLTKWHRLRNHKKQLKIILNLGKGLPYVTNPTTNLLKLQLDPCVEL